ncbi:MAG TPA: FAD-dependent oxidoreductase [Chloroflexota bacterium]|nr:FAD-dependent oxidoreductase [Chloroflexota bacterium]
MTVELPAILIVSHEPSVLRTLEGDLHPEFSMEYQIRPAPSGAAGLEIMRQCALRGQPVAMLIADYSMPAMTGVAFLTEAAQLAPSARRVLLAAYDDSQAAISAINEVRLDYFLPRPWGPPRESLYTALHDLLDDWHTTTPRLGAGIRLIGHRWSARSHEIKDYLARNLIPYEWMDVETQEDARQLLTLAGANPAQLPLVLFPDGATLVQPAVAELAERLGLHTRAQQRSYDLVIVGGGPAGLAAAVYGASEGLHTLLLEREAPGGQAGMSARIENYLGFPSGLSGGELTRRAVAQASRFGAEILTPSEVVGVELHGDYRVIRLASGEEISCQALLIATGISYRKLDVPGAERLSGAGVYYGTAIPEALESQGRDVFIVGGGNSAGQAAMYLSQYARSVTVLVRGESLASSMSRYLIAEIESTDRVRVRPQTSVTEVLGESHIEALRLHDGGTDTEAVVPADALFIFTGATPRTDWVGGLLERDDEGFILSGADVMRDGNPPRGWPLERDPYWLETSVAGVFVAGDVRHGSVKRIASATGEGAMAVQLIHGHLAAGSPRRVGWAAAPREHVELLRSSPIFAGLADRDLELLAELAHPVDVPCDQLIIEEGQEGDTLFLVLDGQLEVFTRRDGRDVRLALLTRGHILGEMAVLQQAPRTASVRALCDTRLLVISQSAFLRMLMKNAGALREVLRTVTARVRETESRLRVRSGQ